MSSEQPKEHCKNEGRCIDFSFAPKEWRENNICRLCGCDGDTRSRPHPAPAQIPMKSCFGDFDDCPCDDECVVAAYCLKYQGKPKNSCGLTDSQCHEVQEHEKAEAVRKARGELQQRIDAAIKELESAQGHCDRPVVVRLRIDNAIALLRAGRK